MVEGTKGHELADRLEFLGWGSAHEEALRGAQKVLTAALPGAVDQFYARLQSWGQLTAMFADQSRQKYARDAQVQHWQSLFTGVFGQAYWDSARQIGKVHSRIGLEPRWFLGAYSQILGALYEACVPATPVERLPLLLQSLTHAVTLDMDLVISMYLEENKVSHQKNLESLSHTFRASVDENLSAVSRNVEAAAGQIHTRVAEMVERSRQVDIASRGSSDNVQSMAAALEELSRSVTEIRQQTTRSALLSETAVGLTRGIDKVMGSLAAAVVRIGTSVEQINDIAERTNILAINASIEAARAGAVGRGFAVVASEVRNLAAQTVSATQSIGLETESLRKSSQESVKAVQEIVKVIRDFDESTTTIAGAIEEQGVVTSQTAQNAQAVAQDSLSVTENIAVVVQVAESTGRVAEGLEEVLAGMKTDLKKLNARVEDFLAQL